MAIQATSRVIIDGPRNLVMQFTGVCDGIGSNETNEIKVDVSELVPAPRNVSIEHVQYEVSGGIVRVLWNANDPVTALDLASVGEFYYRDIGGLPNGGGDTANGDILFSTLGFDVGSSYSVKLTMKKKF